MSDKKFVNGMRAYKPNEKAPSFVKADVVITKSELTSWLSSQEENIRITLKESQKGGLYFELNDFKKGDGLPF